ncbi:unnamed protein product [Allacma fusca]|uniref:Uncharacterized protein n=1 Tax=Allacma fusca TaxID=39272 RepID=A0A8J2KB34_9HEXA|nr:unnamed protein product [Allacma fusca]
MEFTSLRLLLVYSGGVLLFRTSSVLSLHYENQVSEDGLTSLEKGLGTAVTEDSSITSEVYQLSSGGSRKIRDDSTSLGTRMDPGIIPREDINSWGCYYFWSVSVGEGDVEYLSEIDVQTCFNHCHNKDGDTPVALIRGVQCICTTWDSDFLSLRLDNDYCKLQCNEGSTGASGTSFCGGNVAASAYCSKRDGRCEINTDTHKVLDDYNIMDLKKFYDPLRNEDMVKPIFESQQCLRCPQGVEDCFSMSFFKQPQDYFPLNDPIACVLNCRRKFWYENKMRSFRVAYLTWRGNAELGLYVPYCVCREDYPGNDTVTFVEEDQGQCDTQCPSNDLPAYCGNRTDRTILSAYCTSEQQPCLPLGQPNYEEPDDPSDGNPGPEPSNATSTSSTTKPDDRSESTPKQITSTTPSTTTEAQATEPSRNCSKKCRATVNDRLWEGCPGKFVTRPCRNGAAGLEKWYCLENAVFQNSMPDSSNCMTEWHSEMYKEFKTTLEKNNQSLTKNEAESFLSRMEVHCRPNETNTLPYYGHEIKNISDVMREIVNVTKVSLDELSKLLGKAMTLSGLLLSNKDPWQDLGEVSMRSEIGMAFFANLEQSAFTLSKLVNTEYSASYKASMLASDQFVLNFGARRNSSEKELIFPLDSAKSSYIRMDEGWENLVPEPDYVGYMVDTSLYDHIFPAELNSINTGENQILNGKLLSLTIKGLQRGNLQGRKVQITFQHHLEAWGNQVHNFPRKLHPSETPKVSLNTAVCVFWSVQTKTWSRDGCKLIQSNATHTVCECGHLTSFAVLMDPHNYVGKDLALEVLTFVLCPISVVCLLACLVVLSTVHAIQCQRTTITKHLCFCLTIGMILVLFVVDRNYFSLPTDFCVAAGIVTHYIYLAAFMWMAIEGVHLYKMVVHVFDSGRSHTTTYRVTAYGVPVLIVGITCVVGFLLKHQPYGGEMYCWLSETYIWFFMIPVALVVMANMIILFVALKTAIQMKTTTTHLQARQRNYRAWIRGSFSITVLLGLTWMPGFVLTLQSPVVVHVASYFFVFLNTSQGIFLFIFNCFLNEKVRRAAERNLGLPSWLSMSPSPSKDVSKVVELLHRMNLLNGQRSENNRAHSFESGKGDHEAWPKATSQKKSKQTADINSRNLSPDSYPYHIDLAHKDSLERLSDRALNVTNNKANFNANNSSQRAWW